MDFLLRVTGLTRGYKIILHDSDTDASIDSCVIDEAYVEKKSSVPHCVKQLLVRFYTESK